MDYASDFNLAALEEATQEHRRWLGLYRALVAKAMRLGMREQVARHSTANYLRAFISIREKDNARLQRELGSVEIEIGVPARATCHT